MKAQDANLDMISVDVPLVASYSLRGYLAPLDDYFTADDIKKTWLEASSTTIEPRRIESVRLSEFGKVGSRRAMVFGPF